MKKLLYFMLAAIMFVAMCTFISCNDEGLGINGYWEMFGHNFDNTELSAFEVLCSEPNFWTGPHSSTYFYTEPNGKGKCHHDDENPVASGTTDYRFSITSNKITFYHTNHSVTPTAPSYYVEYSLSESYDDTFVFEGAELNGEYKNFYIKILDYDEDNILIETNKGGIIIGDIDYKYSVILLERGKPYKSDWKDDYVTYEEYKEYMWL